jgi:hypothetical protein
MGESVQRRVRFTEPTGIVIVEPLRLCGKKEARLMDPVPREGDGFSLERRVREYSFGSASSVLLLTYIVTATLTEAEAGSPQSALP